jgi:hypothetical protein
MFRLGFVFVLFTAACSSSSNNCPSGDCDPFQTFQDCYNEHHVMESFPTDKAIEVCCIDHPIGSAQKNVVCGATTQTCISYVTANLMDPMDPNLTADINTACTNYPHDSGRM